MNLETASGEKSQFGGANDAKEDCSNEHQGSKVMEGPVKMLGQATPGPPSEKTWSNDSELACTQLIQNPQKPTDSRPLETALGTPSPKVPKLRNAQSSGAALDRALQSNLDNI